MSNAPNPVPAPRKPDGEVRGWQNRHRARPLGRKADDPKLRPWLHLLNDADQADGFEYHNPRLSIFDPQHGL